ncbi:hypothetical protein ARMSODRAFT_1022994 [Armillaria solidipes]|uniref:Uncharacterized protein n=1 Tax=Armillaria solidipes TaxID=1076256 RepID=A0A2H3BNU9_9AGAR|nr:hypothetical protein ARMSODRAFT_1022994 [Armillaria solidipes]
MKSLTKTSAKRLRLRCPAVCTLSASRRKDRRHYDKIRIPLASTVVDQLAKCYLKADDIDRNGTEYMRPLAWSYHYYCSTLKITKKDITDAHIFAVIPAGPEGVA